MAVAERIDSLELIREKVLAGERLDLEDGLVLMQSDDLLALGELADLARRRRGGTA
jgi:aminodeoxyfutalosine synthase